MQSRSNLATVESWVILQRMRICVQNNFRHFVGFYYEIVNYDTIYGILLGKCHKKVNAYNQHIQRLLIKMYVKHVVLFKFVLSQLQVPTTKLGCFNFDICSFTSQLSYICCIFGVVYFYSCELLLTETAKNVVSI